MAPLNPSSNKCYAVSFPSDETDDRLNLKVRTGAATCIVHSRIFAHGGLTFGLNLPELSISNLEILLAKRLQDMNKNSSEVVNWNDYISNELFELNIVERKWMRRVVKTEQGIDHSFPKPRIFHSIVCEEGDVYISGGLTLNVQTSEFEPIADLWKYDLRSNRWICLCDGSSSNKGRYGHSMLFFNSPSPFNKNFHQGLLIIGGKTKGDVNVPEFDFFDLTDNKWVGDAKKVLPIEDLKMSLPNKTEKTQKKVVATNSFDSSVILFGDNGQLDESQSTLIMYTKMGSGSQSSPLIEFPLDLQSQGKRLPIRIDNYTKNVIVPSNLSNCDMGSFGDHLVVTGFGKNQSFISTYLYHKPSGKWSSLKAFCDHDQYSHTISRGFVWASHHRILLLGDRKIRNTLPSVQYFNMFMTVSLPFVNVLGSSFYYTGEKPEQPVQPQKPHEKSFIEYSRYVAPHVQMTSIKSAFPPYAVTLGRNAFERFGYSLSDAELVSADGESVPIALMLCRKRWGRCFEMLISKGYVRAVDNFEKSTVDPEYVCNSDERSDDTNSIKEFEDISSSQELKDLPHFRLPFQDSNNSELLLPRASSSPYSAPSGGDQSRKLSVSSSTSLVVPISPDTSSKVLIPPLKLQPSEPAPQLPKQKFSHFKTPSASSSPRGSISGGLQPFSQIEKPSKEISSKDRKSPNRASRQGSKGSLGVSISRDDSSTSNSKGSVSLISNKPSTKSVAQQLDVNSSKMDPLLLPRAMYLPFTTSTVRALLEFLSTGQVGSKWSIVPTTLDIVLLSKFYELPLLYDLVVEVLYSIIGNKENQLIAEANKLNQQYIDTISKQGEDLVVPTLRCLEGFADFIAKFNDGILDLKILKRISKSRKESDASFKRKKSQDSSSSTSSKLKNFSPIPSAQKLPIAPPTISPLQQKQPVDEEEIEEGDPRYKADLPLEKDVGLDYEDEKNSSENSSSDCIGVGIALVSQPQSEEKPTLAKDDGLSKKTTTTSESMKSKKPSASSSSSKYNSYFVPENTWPSLGQLTAPNAPACTDVIIDFIYEMGALAGDMKLMVRAANVLDISKKFELEKKEILRMMNPNSSGENSSNALKQNQQKPKSLFGKFEMGGSGGASGTRYEKRDSISSMLSNASSSHSVEMLSGTNSNSRYPISSQLSSNAVERVNTFDSAKSLLGAGSKSNSTGKLETVTPQKKVVVASDENITLLDDRISPTVTIESGNSTESKLPLNKGGMKLSGFLKRK